MDRSSTILKFKVWFILLYFPNEDQEGQLVYYESQKFDY